MSQCRAYPRGMLAPKHSDPAGKPRRREFRAALTPAEALLWRRLKRSQLAGHKFRRRHSVGPYVLDFYCPTEKLGIELDGTFDGTAHDHAAPVRRDVFRTAYLAAAGVRLIRFEEGAVVHDLAGVLASIARCCAGRAGRVHVLSDEER